MSKMGAHVLDQQEANAGAPIAPESPQEFGSDDGTTLELGAIELLDPAKPIAEYNPIRAAIATLTETYGKLVFDVSTTKGMDDAKKARMAIRDPRYKIEHIRKALKAPATAFSKRIDDEAKDYTAALLAIETPIDEQIKTREQEIEDERIEREQKAAAERRRVGEAISEIQFLAVYAAGKTAAEIAVVVTELEQRPVDEAEFGDRQAEAMLAKNGTLTKLREMAATAAAQEIAAAKLKAEQEAADRVRQEQEAAAEQIRQQQVDLERQRQELAAQQALIVGATDIRIPPALLNAIADQESAAASTPETARGILEIDEPVAVVAEIDDSNPFPKLVVSEEDEEAEWRASMPPRAALIEAIASNYGVDQSIAEKWLQATFRD